MNVKNLVSLKQERVSNGQRGNNTKVSNIEFLKKRASEFWERANEDFEKGRYNLAALDVEQSVQLWIKYLIYLKSFDFPKTHYLDRLFNELAEVYETKEILEFYKEHSLEFRGLEDAYITSRCFPKEFNKDEIQKIIEFAKKIFKFLEDKLNEKFI